MQKAINIHLPKLTFLDFITKENSIYFHILSRS